MNLFDEKVPQRMILSEEVSFGYNKAAVLNGRYKLYRSEGDNVQWLFDLESDPKEQCCLKLPEVEKELICKVLAHTNGNLSQSAAILGISRPMLRERIKKFGLQIKISSE